MSSDQYSGPGYKALVEELSTDLFKVEPIASQANEVHLKNSNNSTELENRIISLATQTAQQQPSSIQAKSGWLTKIASWFRGGHVQAYYPLCAVMMVAVMTVWLVPITFDSQSSAPLVSKSVVATQSVDELELTFQELWLIENELLFSEEI